MFYAKLKAASLWAAVCVGITCAMIGGVLIAPGFAQQGDKAVPTTPVASAPMPDQKPAPVEFRKVLTMPAENHNDFRHAVIAVSNEQKSLFSRNLIVTDREDPKANSSGLHLWSLGLDKPKRTKLGDSTTFGFIPKSTAGYAVNWGEGVVLWDTRTHTQIGKPFPHELREDTMPLPAISPDGEVMVTRSELKQLQFWDLKTHKPITPAIAQRGIVWSMEFSVDGKWLFSDNSPNELNVWDARTGKLVAGPFRHDAAVDPTMYTPGAQQLVTVENSNQKEQRPA